MRRRNDGSDITSTMNRAWAEWSRNKRIASMARVLAYLFRFEGKEHDVPRAKELTPEDWTLESKIRVEAPSILAKLKADKTITLARNPGLVFEDEHGITANYIHAWLWVGNAETIKAGLSGNP